MGQHIANAVRATYRNILQAVFTLICLPYEAYISADAIIRTFWRLLISRKRLLEWNPSGFIQQKQKSTLLMVYAMMWIVPMIFVAVVIYLLKFSPDSLVVASPFLILWLLSPTIVWWFSLPLPSNKTKVTAQQKFFCGSWRGKPGRSSKILSDLQIIGCRRITFSNILCLLLRIAPLPLTWAWHYCPI